MIGKRLTIEGDIETSDHAHSWLAKRSRHHSQIVRLHAHVAVADRHDLVARFRHQACELGDLVIRGNAARAQQDTNLAFGKIALQFLDNGPHSLIIGINAQ